MSNFKHYHENVTLISSWCYYCPYFKSICTNSCGCHPCGIL